MCSGGVGYGWIGYGDQIRKYGKARRGAARPGNGSHWCGVVSFGTARPGIGAVWKSN